jgi:predicted Zn-dependent protease with MMP-like domain
MRGPLARRPVPIALSRSEKFDDLASDAVDRLTRKWPELEKVRFAVVDVPEVEADRSFEEPVPLGKLAPEEGTTPATVILYRRPLELRAHSRTELEDLVNEILVEFIADLLGMDPDVIDPD